MSSRGFLLSSSAFVIWIAVSPPATLAQKAPVSGPLTLDAIAPDLNARLVGLERAQGVLFGALAAGRIDESDILERMTRRLTSRAARDAEADRGFEALGTRGAQVVRRAYAFHREVLASYAIRSAADRKAALDAVMRGYRNGTRLALPDAPKDMSILYDHAYTSFVPPTPPETEPRRALAYPTLTGFTWAARWYELAVVEPLDRFDDAGELERGLAIVGDRFRAKLSFGTPPQAFPTELPLAPAIAPGLVALHERSAAIIDNLNMMLDVLGDVLIHPGVTNRRAAVDDVITRFTDRQYRCVQAEEWIVAALRHSIFAQGGYALAAMSGYERNAFSGMHGQHYGRRRAPPPCDPE
jgi:hypothetical protein